MATCLLLSRIRVHNCQPMTGGISAATERAWRSNAYWRLPDERVSGVNPVTLRASCESKRNDADYRRWRNKEEEILKDIEPILMLTKHILHSPKYMDGERLTNEDEKSVAEKLLAYHPRSQDKIGCGLQSIKVDRHPQFRNSRCFFVVRSDGGWIDFSYQKCLREYIREKYPTHAERFIREHFKRGSG